MLQPEQLEELKRIAGEIKNLDHLYGSGLLIPLGNKVNSSRASMQYNQTPQSKNFVNPEVPRVVTGYEKLYGDRSTSYYKSERDYEIIDKIYKFEGSNAVYALIVREKGTNYYDIIFRNEVESFAETSGVKLNNTVIDSKKVGDSIEKGEIPWRSWSYTDDMNYRMGINAKTLYMVDPAIVEDGFRISESFAKKLRVSEVAHFKIPKNTNDVLLNFYGDSETYKAFPDIGEKVKNKVICGRRRIDYNNAHYMMKSKNLRKEMFGDTLYCGDFQDGTVVDIDIFCNVPVNEIPDDRINEQLLRYITSINRYWAKLYRILNEIISKPENEYSDDVGITFARARDRMSIDKFVKWDDDGSIFDHMIIHITILNTKKAAFGSKLVGRHGNKGVITDIVPDHLMPRSEDGTHADIIFSALSVIGRLNISQNYEHELNWVVDCILESSGSQKEKYEALLDLLSICNPDQEKVMREFYSSLSKEDKKQFLKELDTEFVIFQPASKSLTFANYEKIIDRFDPKKKRFTIQDEKGNIFNIQSKMIMSDSYVFRLKHEPITKFSVRSKGTINPRTFLPIKSHAYSRGTALFNNQALRLGNMEMDILNLCNDPAAINFFTRLYCTSVVGRREFAQLMSTNVFTEDLQINIENPKSRVVDYFNATMLTCGMALDFKVNHEEIEQDTSVLEELQDMSSKALKLVFKEGSKYDLSNYQR